MPFCEWKGFMRPPSIRRRKGTGGIRSRQVTREALEETVEATGYQIIRPAAPAGKGNLLHLKVIGMDNPHCLGTVKGALASLPGILSQELFLNERAIIAFDPQILSPDRIKETILQQGTRP